MGTVVLYILVRNLRFDARLRAKNEL